MIKPGIHERGPLKTIFNVDNSISKSQWLWSKSHKPINSNYQHILILTSWCDIQTSNFVFKCCVAERKKKKKKKRSAEPADMQGNFFITMALWLPTYMYI